MSAHPNPSQSCHRSVKIWCFGISCVWKYCMIGFNSPRVDQKDDRQMFLFVFSFIYIISAGNAASLAQKDPSKGHPCDFGFYPWWIVIAFSEWKARLLIRWLIGGYLLHNAQMFVCFYCCLYFAEPGNNSVTYGDHRVIDTKLWEWNAATEQAKGKY